MSDQPKETFEQFKNSFSYSTRTDLDFKWLKSLSDEDAAAFFVGLLAKASEAADDGDTSRLADHIVEYTKLGYIKPGAFVYEDGGLAPLSKPLSECNVALLTTSGHFVEGEDPQPFGVENMTQTEAIERISDFIRAKPTLSFIPPDVESGKLRTRHGGYPIRSAQDDPNVAIPIDHMCDLADEGVIGSYVGAYSFVGATSQIRLQKESIPEWIAELRSKNTEVAFLVPV